MALQELVRLSPLLVMVLMAPALKFDIGVAMVVGNRCCQGIADMILTDDHFVSIVHAVEEGRAFIEIFKISIFLIPIHLKLPLLSLLLVLFGTHTFFPNWLKILVIDLCGTDMVPALGLGLNHLEEE